MLRKWGVKMAKKTNWGFDKKLANKRRAGQDFFYEFGKALKKMPSGKKRKSRKRSYSSKKSYSSSTTRKDTVRKTTSQNQIQEPMTGSEVLAVCVFLAVIVAFFILVSKIGFLKAVFLSLIVMAVAVVIIGVTAEKKAARDAEMQKYLNTEPEETDRSNQIPYLKSLLEEIRKHQTIVNTSNDPDEVKKHLDCLLGVMEEITTFDEALLKQAGMTKANYESSRAGLLEVYDTMIAQAGENNTEDSSKEQPEAEQPQEQQPVITNERIVPLEAYLKVATPSNQGLYPHEILMLHYANTYKMNGDSRFQSFWLYQYSVEEPQSVLDSLQSRGFLTVGDLRSELERCKVTELKAQLQTLGEKTTGKKAELIDRLLNSGNNEYVEAQFPDRYYALTDAGSKELSENEYVVYLHKTGRMSVWEMNQRLANNAANFSYRDFLWQSFNEQAEQHYVDADMGLYRNVRLTMYQFLMEEGKVHTAFGHLCEVIAYDLSSMDNWEEHNPSPELLKLKVESALKYCFPYTGSQASLPPMIIKWIAEMQQKLEMSDADFRVALLEQFEEIHLLRRIFTNEECADIVMNEIGNHPRKLAAIYRQAEERLKQQYESMT